MCVLGILILAAYNPLVLLCLYPKECTSPALLCLLCQFSTTQQLLVFLSAVMIISLLLLKCMSKLETTIPELFTQELVVRASIIFLGVCWVFVV